MTARRKPRTARSPKAGRPPESSPAPPQVRRRRKTAEARFRKDGSVQQFDGTPEPLVAARAPERGGKRRHV
jgi:hypothetical protein